MDQLPMDGAEPLAPPNAETARAYLEELEVVRSRRESRIDRRALAAFSLINAVVLSVYVTIAVCTIGVTPTNTLFLVFLAIFLLWVQLGAEYRESHGALGSPLSSSRAVTFSIVAVLVVAIIGGFVASLVSAELPVLVRWVPGILVLLLTGVPAVRDMRRSVRRDATVQRRRLLRAEQWATIAIGAIMAASIWVLGAGNPIVVPFFAMLLMGGYLAWWIAGRISERLPALGAVWARSQWSVFAIAGGVIAAIMLGHILGLSATVTAFAPFSAVIVLLLFIGSAFLDGRDG